MSEAEMQELGASILEDSVAETKAEAPIEQPNEGIPAVNEVNPREALQQQTEEKDKIRIEEIR